MRPSAAARVWRFFFLSLFFYLFVSFSFLSFFHLLHNPFKSLHTSIKATHVCRG